MHSIYQSADTRHWDSTLKASALADFSTWRLSCESEIFVGLPARGKNHGQCLQWRFPRQTYQCVTAYTQHLQRSNLRASAKSADAINPIAPKAKSALRRVRMRSESVTSPHEQILIWFDRTPSSFSMYYPLQYREIEREADKSFQLITYRVKTA